MARYKIFNGPMPTTASQAAVATGTGIISLLQVKASATATFRVCAWGISFDASAAATPGICELIETDVAATVTAHVNAGIHRIDGDAIGNGDTTTNILPVGTTSTGYTSTGEGTIAAIRTFDAQHIAPTNQYVYQFPLGTEPMVQVSKFLRIRVKFASTVNAICWVEVLV